MSGLMSVDKKKVLHIDRNDYYGGAAASLDLDQVRSPLLERSLCIARSLHAILPARRLRLMRARRACSAAVF